MVIPMDDVTMEEVTTRRLSRRTILGFVLTTAASAALLILLFARLMAASQNAATVSQSPLIGHAAPDFTISVWNGTTGEKIHLAALKGKPVVVNFWSSTCIPCQDESQVLTDGARRYAAQGVVFVGVNFDDATADGVAFLKKYGITYPTGPDTTGSIVVAYGVTGVPETAFIDRNGVVVDKFGGALTARFLDERVAQILK
jgi:cytochrome c biogenesis protein CcmG/thiol:disulfide interchange protein DsbE